MFTLFTFFFIEIKNKEIKGVRGIRIMPNTPNFYAIRVRMKVNVNSEGVTSVSRPVVRERDIEAYLRDRVKAIGGIAYKFESPGNAGVPDRLVLLPGGRVEFVELKAPGKKPTALQEVQHARIRALGFAVKVIDSKERVDDWAEEVMPS